MSDRWSDDGMIFYCDGLGYALDIEGNTVCIGNEEEIRSVIEGEAGLDKVKNKKERECIEIIIEYRRKNGYGKQSKHISKRSFVGSRPVRDFKHRKENARRSPSRKRIPLCKVGQEK